MCIFFWVTILEKQRIPRKERKKKSKSPNRASPKKNPQFDEPTSPEKSPDLGKPEFVRF